MRLLRWVKRRWYMVLGLLALLLLATAYLFPLLLKRYIEAHSEEWIHRKVTIGSIVLQPFTGVYAIKDLACYEPKSDVVFVRFAKLGVKADLLDGYRKGNWRFREAELRAPYFRVAQNGERFNFSDLLELGGNEKEGPEAADTTSVAFDLKGLAISGGRIDYSSDILHEPMSVTDLNVTCSRISSAQAVMEFLLGFGIGGGEVKGGFILDTQAGGYSVNAQLRKFGLPHVLPYLKDFMDCKTLGGELDVDLALHDSYVDSNSLDLSAASTIRQFKLEDPEGELLMGFHELRAELDTLTASNGHFEIGDVKLNSAELRFILLNDWSDNWTRLLKLEEDSATVDGATSATSESNIFVMLADYVSYLGSQFVASDYSAKSVTLNDCALHFEDYTPRLPFKYDVSGLSMSANKVSSAADAGQVHASAVLNGSGKLSATAAFDPGNLRNVMVDLSVNGLRLRPFDPYSRWYAAHPMEDGVGAYTTRTVLNNGTIDSENTILIDKLMLGKKVQEHDTGIYVLPLRLAAGLLKDAKGVVKLDVPVKGDLRDPQFRVWPIVWQIFKNLIVKAATAPANLLARAIGGADEKELEEVRMEFAQAVPARQQWKTLELLAKAMSAKQELRVDLVPLVDAMQEEQEIALFLAKQRFLFQDNPLTAADSAQVTALLNTDSSFVRFVVQATPAQGGRPIQDRCLAMMGEDAVRSQQQDMEYARNEHVMQFLLSSGVAADRVAYRKGTVEELGGRTGKPGYRFMYDAAEPSLNSNPAP